MKKGISRILIVLLFLVSLGVLVGNPEEVRAKGRVVEYNESTDEATEMDQIPCPLIKNKWDRLENDQKLYGVMISKGEKTVTVPIQMEYTGKVALNLFVQKGDITKAVDYYFSKDEAGEEVLATMKSGEAEELLDDLYMDNMYINATKGRYYLTIKVNETLKQDTFFFIKTEGLYTKDRVLKHRDQLISGFSGKPIYYKINVKKPRELQFSFYGSELLGNQVVLCDENKKPISKVEVIGKDQYFSIKTYVVPKGTYYYCVNTKNNRFTIDYRAYSYTSEKKISYSKPKMLKNDTSVTSYFSLSDKKQEKRYYQYQAKKSHELKGLYIEFNTGGSGTIEVAIKLPGKQWTTKKLTQGQVYKISDKKIQQKGSYKIRIRKVSNDTTGTCTIGTNEYIDISDLMDSL